MAPYLRIVAEIRRRIEAGELQPGSRAPSARQITQQWGVAIATATKVLAELQREGLVKSVPGIGTVVTGQSTVDTTPPDAGPPALGRERIVRAAVDIADVEGIAAVSMRRIATELDVSTMSLYRHVRGKDELLVFMIDLAFASIRLPEKRPRGWRARLELALRALWALFRRHRWLAPVMSVTRPQLAPHALTYTEWVLGAIAPFGLDAGTTMHIHVMLFAYARGLATSLEPEAEAERDTGMNSDEWMQTQEASLASLGDSPAFVNLMRMVDAQGFELDLDTLFEFGLARILDGLAVMIRTR